LLLRVVFGYNSFNKFPGEKMKNVLKSLLLLTVCMLLPLSASTKIDVDKSVDKLIELTKVKESVELLAPVVALTLKQTGQITDEKTLNRIEQAINSVYKPKLFIDPIKKQAKAKLTPDQINELVKWYESPIGIKSTQASLNVLSADTLMKLLKKENVKVGKDKEKLIKGLLEETMPKNASPQEKMQAEQIYKIAYKDLSVKELKACLRESKKDYVKTYNDIVSDTFNKVQTDTQTELQMAMMEAMMGK
jgi:hypothetical protein